MIDWARRHPVTTYYVLAVAISTGLALLDAQPITPRPSRVAVA